MKRGVQRGHCTCIYSYTHNIVSLTPCECVTSRPCSDGISFVCCNGALATCTSPFR